MTPATTPPNRTSRRLALNLSKELNLPSPRVARRRFAIPRLVAASLPVGPTLRKNCSASGTAHSSWTRMSSKSRPGNGRWTICHQPKEAAGQATRLIIGTTDLEDSKMGRCGRGQRPERADVQNAGGRAKGRAVVVLRRPARIREQKLLQALHTKEQRARAKTPPIDGGEALGAILPHQKTSAGGPRFLTQDHALAKSMPRPRLHRWVMTRTRTPQPYHTSV